MKRILMTTGLLVLITMYSIVLMAGKKACDKVSSGHCKSDTRTLIGSVEEFRKTRTAIAKTPWGGAELLVHALLQRQYNKALSEKLLLLSLSEHILDKSGKPVFKGYRWRKTTDYLLGQIDKNPHCIRSYVVKSSHRNNYKIDPSTIQVRFRVQKRLVGSIKSGRYKVFVCSTGTSTCRPVTLKRNSFGHWKAIEFSTLAVGCARGSTGRIRKMEKDL